MLLCPVSDRRCTRNCERSPENPALAGLCERLGFAPMKERKGNGMSQEYFDPPDVIERRKASQPHWITDEGRNVNGFIRVAYAPDGQQYGTPMIDPADGEFVWVPGED